MPSCLQEPPILMRPFEGRPLIMYLTVLENLMGCVLGQHNESGRKEHVLYPKICPPIFFKIWQDQGSTSLKGCTVQLPPNTVKIRVLVLAKKLRFSRVQSSPICLYTLSSIHMSSFKTHNIKLQSQKP